MIFHFTYINRVKEHKYDMSFYLYKSKKGRYVCMVCHFIYIYEVKEYNLYQNHFT